MMKIHYVMQKIGVVMALSLTAIPLISQEVNTDTLVIEEVVISSSKYLRSAGNITQKIDVIREVEIRSSFTGNNNIAEILMKKPGASVSALSRNDANWGTYGGIGPKYSTYMLSGMPVDAFIDPMSLDLAVVDRIEIQRGPASVLYPNYLSQDFAGNQSPLAGTVNLLLKERVEQPETRFAASYGSYNTLNAQVFHQGRVENLHFFGGMNYEMSDYTNYGTENSWLNMQDDPQYQKIKGFAGVAWYYGDHEQHKLQVFVNSTGHNGDAGRVYRGFSHHYTTLQANQTTELKENLHLNAGFGIRVYDRSWQESQFNGIDSLLSNNGVNQLIVPADLNLTLAHGSGHLLTLGADYQGATYDTWSNPLKGYSQYGNKSTALQAGLYLQEELRFKALTARAGIRYNYVGNTIELINGGAPGQPEKDWQRLLWSAGVKYNLSPSLSVFANAGNSYLTPGLKSVGGTISLSDQGVIGRNGQLPNPDLKPESGIGLDAGLNGRFGKNISVSARAFSLVIEDAIVENVVSENPSQTQSVNVGKSTSSGVEVEINHKPGHNFSWFANYTYMKTNVSNPVDEDQDGAAVPFAPEHVANAGVSLMTSFGLQVDPYLNYNGGYYDSSSKSGRRQFKPGTLINLYAAQNLASKEHYNLKVFLQLYNLTDNRYEMPWQFRNTGFAITTGIRLTLI